MTDSDTCKRFVITHIGALGLRTFTFPAQGRFTYESREAAQTALSLYRIDLRNKILGKRADTLAVRQVRCWLGHYDPVGCYFEGPKSPEYHPGFKK